MADSRNYGIDLLRLVLMFMVCVLHTLGQGGILAACTKGTLEYNIYWLLEILCYSAVNGFAIISGYMAKDKPQKYSKLVNMWFMALFYSLVITVLLSLFGVGGEISIDRYISLSLPVTHGAFWYFTAYFALFLAIPVLNKFLFSIDQGTAKVALLVAFIVFSLISFAKDPFKTDFGYSAIWLIILYCIGVLAKRARLFESKSTLVLVIMLAASVLLTWVLKIFHEDGGKWVKYISPTILLCGLLLVVLFSRLQLRGGIIKHLSPLAFGIYLYQMSFIIWNTLIKGAFAFVATMNIWLGVLIALGFACSIFVSGLIVEFIRVQLFKLARVHILSEKISALIGKLLSGAANLLD